MNRSTGRLWLAVCAVLVGGGLLALVLLTALHAELARLAGFDRAVMAGVHGWSSPLLDAVMLGLAKLGAIAYFGSGVGVVVLFLLSQRRIHAAAVLSGAVLGAFALNETLKLHFHRVRPQVAWALAHERTFSFPSGHALFATGFYGTLAYLALLRPTRPGRKAAVLLPAILLPLAIGLCRIYLGAHFPSDVLGGYVAGGIWLATVIAADRLWRRHVHTQAAQREITARPWPSRLRSYGRHRFHRP